MSRRSQRPWTSAPPRARRRPADLPLPSLDSIVPGADVSAFFQAHVPEALRNAALRKLWTTDPEISGFIEMADYQWDFNNPDSIPGWGRGSTCPMSADWRDVCSAELRMSAPLTPTKTPRRSGFGSGIARK